MYTLHKETTVQTSMKEAWEFIHKPANLNLITPPDMQFEILSEVAEKMHEGMLVEYRVKIPIIGNQPWLSELKHIREGLSFVDEQKIGPYKLWYHFHGLEECGDRVRFIDRITYEVPFGIFGKIAHALFIRKTLERIFHYREIKFKELLNKPTEA